MKKTLIPVLFLILASLPIQSEILYGVSNTFALGTISAVNRTDHAKTLGLDAQPNPFNPAVTIKIRGLRSTDFPVLQIFDIKGALILHVSGNALSEGHYLWNAKNSFGASVGCGFYLIRLSCSGQNLIKQVLYIK